MWLLKVMFMFMDLKIIDNFQNIINTTLLITIRLQTVTGQIEELFESVRFQLIFIYFLRQCSLSYYQFHLLLLIFLKIFCVASNFILIKFCVMF